jgi:hypothetical protein
MRSAAESIRRVRLQSGRTAVLLGTLALALTVLYVPLAWPARDISDGWDVLLSLLGFAVPGVVVARRLPRNPIGWILIGLGLLGIFYVDASRYAVFDYHFHHGGLPFGRAAVVVDQALWGTAQFFVLPLVILLFPDGRLTRRWRVVQWAYVADVALLVVGFLAVTAWEVAAVQPVAVDGQGQLISYPTPPAALTWAAHAVNVLAPVFWAAFVARQVSSWRRASGERRQQLKWLLSGSVVTVLGLVGIFGFGFSNRPLILALDIVSFFATFALPVAICVAILRYRLYEIDRIISRTLAYAIVSGLLVGVYAGLVLLATRVLPLSSPVAVAAATLAVAALFTPVRRRVQRIVDRRFNRARYDADRTVEAFAGRLKDAVDLDTVLADLAGLVRQTLEPAHVSVWLNTDL